MIHPSIYHLSYTYYLSIHLSIHVSCIYLTDINQSDLCIHPSTVSPVSPVDRLTELLLNSSGHKSTVTNGNQELSSK